ncbi:hypothetical protein CEXT_491661 [Caerostris extrusa]|uniref:Uncharacterized protein n=1 Tax=Caerostris extrusa TaxID=172846 RepID=A0AAV4U2Y0_CAEEX|nr:hypothetical protein CEXT_491661 [Caerostris extrusa]
MIRQFCFPSFFSSFVRSLPSPSSLSKEYFRNLSQSSETRLKTKSKHCEKPPVRLRGTLMTSKLQHWRDWNRIQLRNRVCAKRRLETAGIRLDAERDKKPKVFIQGGLKVCNRQVITQP